MQAARSLKPNKGEQSPVFHVGSPGSKEMLPNSSPFLGQFIPPIAHVGSSSQRHGSENKSPEEKGQSSSGDRRNLTWSHFHVESVKLSTSMELSLNKIKTGISNQSKNPHRFFPDVPLAGAMPVLLQEGSKHRDNTCS